MVLKSLTMLTELRTNVPRGNLINITAPVYTRVVCKVRGSTILLQVRNLWRCDDGLFFEVPPLASDALLTTLHPLLETCCRPLMTSKFLASKLPFHGWKSPEIAWGEICTVWRMFYWGPLFPSRTQNSIQISPHAITGLFQPWKRSSEARNFEVINGLQHVFEKWVERCKKCIARQGWYFEKECHRIFTNFRVGVIMWVQEFCKWPSYKFHKVVFIFGSSIRRADSVCVTSSLKTLLLTREVMSSQFLGYKNRVLRL
jgi:hypothetical protein